MQNNLFLLLAWCVGTCIVFASSLMAQADSSIDSILLANEFKAEQRSQLNTLPLSSISDLTQRLNSAASDDPKTGRLFEFLTLKVKQFEGEMPKATRDAAIGALRLKIKAATTPVTEYRKSLLMSLEARTPESESTTPQTPTAKPPSVVQPTAPKKALEAKPMTSTPSEEPISSTPWSIIVVLIVVACGLLWLLLKRRS